jgi:hypothetical protein
VYDQTVQFNDITDVGDVGNWTDDTGGALTAKAKMTF